MITTLAFLTMLAAPASYDPLMVPEAKPQVVDTAWTDAKRKRTLLIRLYFLDNAKSAPMVIFSHGLGGTCRGNAFLGEHLAKRGYVAVFVQHPGSDESVWRDVPLAQRMAAMNKAASAQNFQLRVGDVKFVIDQAAREPKLKGKVDLRRVGMSGHSFGAVTTQAVSGQWFPGIQQTLTEPRIRSAIAYSPSMPRAGGDSSRSFGNVKIPWLLMTGTDDTSPIGNQSAASRREIFPGLPPGQKYQVVLFEAEHSAFTDSALPGDRKAINPNHHRAMLALTAAFWDSTLRGDVQARAWLDGSGPRTVLGAKDVWQKK